MRSKNKQILVKNVDNFFNWIKGAELVELKKCNTKEEAQNFVLKNIDTSITKNPSRFSEINNMRSETDTLDCLNCHAISNAMRFTINDRKGIWLMLVAMLGGE